ncbi:MAG: DUF5671 domain-containing protein [Patescibacteria group bacterium]|nr:DUF5671 domain-containing protein [Patescibacteria group bacterium]
MEPTKNSPKYFFLHLLAIIALYMSAAGLITLLFQYINVLFPDPLAYSNYNGIASAIRYAMASLIIIFPVYIFISRMLYREYLAEPEKREYRFRKWLVYFTLFAAGITIITDLIVLIYNFLGGDLSSRFILKILVVLLIAAVVFWYYRKDLKNALSVKQVGVLSYGASAFVLLAIIFGFFTAGSPLKARLYNFDERKVNDLTNIQYQIINYWQRKQILPNTLSDLTDSISGFTAPVDPQTNNAYEYNVNSQTSFELCAEFNLPSNFGLIGRSVNAYPAGAVNDNWDHAAGRVCFERTIDPALYPKINTVAPVVPVK